MKYYMFFLFTLSVCLSAMEVEELAAKLEAALYKKSTNLQPRSGILKKNYNEFSNLQSTSTHKKRKHFQTDKPPSNTSKKRKFNLEAEKLQKKKPRRSNNITQKESLLSREVLLLKKEINNLKEITNHLLNRSLKPATQWKKFPANTKLISSSYESYEYAKSGSDYFKKDNQGNISRMTLQEKCLLAVSTDKLKKKLLEEHPLINFHQHSSK